MPVSTFNNRALLAARSNVARAYVCRSGWVPKDTKATPIGRYIWDNTRGMYSQQPTTTWTAVRR